MELKFKIWDSGKQRMSTPIGIVDGFLSWTGTESSFISWEDGDIDMPGLFAESRKDTFKFLQSVGLTDTDGEEAYIDDFIRFTTTEGVILEKRIGWSKELCCVIIGGMPYNKLRDSAFIQPSNLVFKIIGNANSHPHFLLL